MEFTRVFAEDRDDPTTPNADLLYTLVSQIPSRKDLIYFHINRETGAISTTQEGESPEHRRPSLWSVRR